MTEHPESDQTAQRRANFEAIRQLGVDVYPRRFDARATVSEVVAAHGHATGAELEAQGVQVRVAGRILGMRTFGKANFLVLVRREGPPAGVCAAGLRAGNRLQRVPAPGLRRLGRRGGADVPHQDQRADRVGVEPHLPGEVLSPAAREVARSDRRGNPVSPAVPGSGGQPRLATRVRDAEPRRVLDAGLPGGSRVSRGRDADDAVGRRRRAGTSRS